MEKHRYMESERKGNGQQHGRNPSTRASPNNLETHQCEEMKGHWPHTGVESMDQ